MPLYLGRTRIGSHVMQPFFKLLQSKIIRPSKETQTIIPDYGYDGMSEVTIEGDANLVAENIAEGVSIFGITGTHFGGTDTTDATATASDIISGKTAYVNGKKVTGTILNAEDETF